MTSKLGDAEDKYTQKIDEEDDLIFTSAEITDINDGKTVIKTIPLKENPVITYNGILEEEGEGGGGRGSAQIEISVDKRKLRQIMENWGLPFSKPGRKYKKVYKVLTGVNGIEENQEKTLEAMLERQVGTGYFSKHGFKVDIKDEDMRFNFIEERLIPNLSATFIIMRDISGSMDRYSEFSATIAGLIEFWLRERYEDIVKIRYVAHTDDAFEFDPRKKEDFYKLTAGGGTAFEPAYNLVFQMTEGVAYNSMSQYRERIDYESEDVFLLHITDGENSDDEANLYNTLKKLFPRLRRVFYLQVGDNYTQLSSNANKFYEMIKSINPKEVRATKSGSDVSYTNVKKVLDALLK
ncbi:MAG: DUF444 family protein [Candidatus Micrarchaeaceae archaeon]|nr:DUF444 family protein [Candidatus Parvarchaeota archaeon]